MLKDYERKDKLESLASYFRIHALPWGELRAALFIQDRWRRYVHARALETDTIFAWMNEARADLPPSWPLLQPSDGPGLIRLPRRGRARSCGADPSEGRAPSPP